MNRIIGIIMGKIQKYGLEILFWNKQIQKYIQIYSEVSNLKVKNSKIYFGVFKFFKMFKREKNY